MDDLRTNRDVPGVNVTKPDATGPSKRGWRGRLWVIPVLVVIGAIAWHFRPQPAAQHPGGSRFGGRPGAMTMPVTPATAQKGDVPITLSALGTVTPLATVTVKTQIAGQLVKIGFKEGQVVHAGDFLAQIDPRPYQLSLTQYEGTLLKDQALLKQGRQDLARYRRLAAQDSVARQTVDAEVSLVQQYEGAIKTDQAQIGSARLNLVYCHIVAPVSGRVGLRQVDVGNYVQTSDTDGIVVITQMQPMDVEFTLPEDDLPTVLKRFHGNAKLAVTAFDRSQTVKLATGVLKTIDNEIDTNTGTVKLKAEFDNKDEALFPNQFVNIRLLVDTLHGATVIPVAAVQRGAVGTFVYLIDPRSHTVTAQAVTLGPTDGIETAVSKGLTPGQMVVVDGADKLRDGAKVLLPGEVPPAPAGGNGQPHGKRQ